MRTLALDDFSGATGEAFAVDAGEGSFELTLEAAEPLRPSGREGGSFRLEFRGPREPVLPQAIYPFRRDDETFDIFIVPIAQDAAGTRYEAIFF
jgi:hypothetical protein